MRPRRGFILPENTVVDTFMFTNRISAGGGILYEYQICLPTKGFLQFNQVGYCLLVAARRHLYRQCRLGPPSTRLGPLPPAATLASQPSAIASQPFSPCRRRATFAPSSGAGYRATRARIGIHAYLGDWGPMPGGTYGPVPGGTYGLWPMVRGVTWGRQTCLA